VPITDTTATYNVYVNVRNTSEYPYQNFWFFIEKSFDTQPTVSKDTVECYLAYDNGKWIGNGVGAAFDMPVLIEQNLKFAAAGTYRYKIYQGMREDNLQGIRDIGLRVEKIEE
jgi:gliding motility-associated lipoprotein GldH